MLNLSTLQPFRISFYKYSVNSKQLQQFENLFCGWLGFSKSAEIAHQTYVYNNHSTYYVIQITDKVSSPTLDGIGIQLTKRKGEVLLSSSNATSTKAEAHLYAQSLFNKSKVTQYLTGNILPIAGVEVSGIQFYFTVPEDFHQGGLFYNSQSTSSTQYINSAAEHQYIKPSELRENVFLYHHHVAFYRSALQTKVIEEFFQDGLGLKAKNSYLIPSAQQYVAAFQLNQVRLNTIQSTDSNQICTVESENFYSHGALGTTNIIQFARKLSEASNFSENSVKIIPMGGNEAKAHHLNTSKMYGHLLSKNQLADLEKYHINFDRDSDNPKNSGAQCFFRSILGLMEAIQTEGEFSFLPRVGEGVTKGINFNSGVR